MTLVPAGDPFRAEVKLSPSDIGFIHEGQKVKIKLLSYDYARFGSISGEVKHVLPGNFNDERGGVYHKAIVEFHDKHLKNQPDKKLLAGMQLQADIRLYRQEAVDLMCLLNLRIRLDVLNQMLKSEFKEQ